MGVLSPCWPKLTLPFTLCAPGGWLRSSEGCKGCQETDRPNPRGGGLRGSPKWRGQTPERGQQRPRLSHHPPPLDVGGQVHVLPSPDGGDVAVEVAVEPLGGTGVTHAAATGAALAGQPLLAEALQASIARHQLHPGSPVQGARVQVGQGGRAMVGVYFPELIYLISENMYLLTNFIKFLHLSPPPNSFVIINLVTVFIPGTMYVSWIYLIQDFGY